MKVVVGLGNPGGKYKNTRHNAGFMAVDFLAGENLWKLNKKFEAEMCICDASGRRPVVLVKPLTFMNESGRSVRKIVDFYKLKIDDLLVIHDDLDIALGEYKIQKGIGPKGHKGVLSVENHVGHGFSRVRIGVENRIDRSVSGEEYTLIDFGKEERKKIDLIIKKIIEEICI
jgi:peptidyl-tRNA hydrolase, PTH1 family